MERLLIRSLEEEIRCACTFWNLPTQTFKQNAYNNTFFGPGDIKSPEEVDCQGEDCYFSGPLTGLVTRVC